MFKIKQLTIKIFSGNELIKTVNHIMDDNGQEIDYFAFEYNQQASEIKPTQVELEATDNLGKTYKIVESIEY